MAFSVRTDVVLSVSGAGFRASTIQDFIGTLNYVYLPYLYKPQVQTNPKNRSFETRHSGTAVYSIIP